MDRQLKRNAVALTLLQIGQYLVPLTIFPYLSRVLGVEGFGQFGFALAFTVYFVVLVEWGFNLSSTREISINRSDRSARSKVFWNTLLARGGLACASILFLSLLISSVPKLSAVSALLWMGILQVLAAFFSTAFYYQGIEKMTAMAVINFSIRLVSVPLTMLFVTAENHVTLAFGIQAGCFLISSLVNLWLLLKSREIAWIAPQPRIAYELTKSSSPLFLSYAGSSLYTNSNTVILGFVASQAAVGYFVAGFTLVKAVVGLTAPFAQAVFPRASQVLNLNGIILANPLIKLFRMQILLGLALSLALVLFMPWGVTWFYGEAFQESIPVVGWLSALPVVICLASVLGMQTLIPLGRNRWFSIVILMSGIFNCILLFVMGYIWGEVGAAISVLITEIAIMFSMAIGVRRFAPDIWNQLIKIS